MSNSTNHIPAYIIIFGTSRNSGKMELKPTNYSAMFESNKSSIFRLTSTSVGPIKKIKFVIHINEF